MPPFLPFVGGSYRVQNPVSGSEELINWYVERAESRGATSPQGLLPTPGYTAFATAVATGWRAAFTDDQTGRTFGVVGASFVEVSAGGVVTVHGSVAVDENPATISTNGVGGGQLLITSGSNAYSFDLGTNTLTLEVSGEATMGAVLYGFGLIFNKATGRVRLSDLFDLTAWDPTQFFERSINTDPWQAMHVTPYGYIVLPGTQTGENWYNAGTSPIPFAPDPSGNFADGIAATFSITQVGDDVQWLARSVEGGYRVVAMSGFTPQRISQHGVEFEISGYDTVDDAIGQCVGDQGHIFYLLTFPTAKVTWARDALTREWAKRGTWIVENGAYTYARPVFHTFAFGRHLMGDREGMTLYAVDPDVATDVEDRPIRRLRRSPMLLNQDRRILVTSLELLMQVGIGVQSGQGENPLVTLRVSRDGGFTWGNEHPCSAGRVGEYWRRVIFRSLGLGRRFVFEIVCSDPVPWRITEAYVNVRATTDQQEAA